MTKQIIMVGMLGLMALCLGSCHQSEETYAANCATPPAGWGREADGIGHLRVVQPIFLGNDGSVNWNGSIISDELLKSYVGEAGKLHPQPQLVLEVGPAAKCDRVRAVRSILTSAAICRAPYPSCSEGWSPKNWAIKGGP